MRIAGTKKWWNPARPAYTIILSHRIRQWLFRWFRDRFSQPDPRIYVTWRFRCSLPLGLLFHRLWPRVHTFRSALLPVGSMEKGGLWNGERTAPTDRRSAPADARARGPTPAGSRGAPARRARRSTRHDRRAARAGI